VGVSDGEAGDQDTFNSSFMDREVDTNTIGKVDLENTDGVSGSSIFNAQKEFNGQASFSGDTTNGAEDRKPTWASDAIGVANQAIVPRVDSVQAVVESNTTAIATKVDKVTSTDDAVVRFDGITGDVQDSGVTIDDSDNVVIPGDLTVNGTTTTINTDTLDVEDANITVNNGGTQATADANDAGFTVEMSDATDTRVGYDSTLTSRFKCGDVGSESEIVTATASQTVTSKDLDLTGAAAATNRAVVSSDTTVNLQGLARKKGVIYFDDTDQKYKGDDGTSLINLGGESATGDPINYLEGNNSDFETSVGDWVAHADATDGDGGAPTVTMTRTTTGSEIIRGSASGKITKDAADRSGEGAAVDFSIDPKDQGGQIIVQIDYKNTANYVSGDIAAYVYDVGNAVLLGKLQNDDDGEFLYHDGDGATFLGVFQAASDSTDYRIFYSIETPSALAYDFIFDRVRVGPDSVAPGFVGTDPQSYTPVITGLGSGGTSVNEASFWREGKFLNVSGHIQKDGTNGTGGTFVEASLPVGLVADDSVEPNPTTVEWPHNAQFNGSFDVQSAIVNFSTNAIRFSDAGANALDGADFTSNSRLRYRVKVPIVGWSAGAMISTTESLFQTINVDSFRSTSTQNFPDATPTALICDDEQLDTHGAYDNTTGIFTAPRKGNYYISAGILFQNTTTWAEIERINMFTATNGTTAQTNDKFINTSNGFDSSGGASAAFSGGSALIRLEKNDTLRIMVDQNSGGALTSIAVAQRTWTTISSLPDFSTFSVFGEYERLETEINALTQTTLADTWTDVTGSTVSIPGAGTWTVGYDSHAWFDWVSTTHTAYANIRLYDNTNSVPIDGTIGHVNSQMSSTNQTDVRHISRNKEFKTTGPVDIIMQIRHNQAIALSGFGVTDPSFTGTLTDPDVENIVWAERKQ
jgi:hypothetical protein